MEKTIHKITIWRVSLTNAKDKTKGLHASFLGLHSVVQNINIFFLSKMIDLITFIIE